MVNVPTDLDRITKMEDAALRNILITQRYHDLSLGLRETVSKTDANWSTFATWASKTAGQSIRDEEVPTFVRALVKSSPDFAQHADRLDTLLAPFGKSAETLLVTPVARTLRDVSKSIGDGNLKVFAELAPQFARFVSSFQDARAYDAAAIGAWTKAFRPGPPDRDDGQDLLVSAFGAYHRAIFETDAVARARLLFLGNLQVGLHEQTRLQPNIADALDAPVVDVLEGHLRDAAAASTPHGWIAGLEQRVLTEIEALFEPLLEAVERVWQRVATRFLMRLALPFGTTISLGEDIPVPPGEEFLPEPLRGALTPDELAALLKRFDRAHGNGDAGTASRDWAMLEDRMNFIVNLFRSRQRDETLFGPPFTPAQLAEVQAGRLPSGAL